MKLKTHSDTPVTLLSYFTCIIHVVTVVLCGGNEVYMTECLESWRNSGMASIVVWRSDMVNNENPTKQTAFE